jgi:hypothetical protein
LLALIGHDAGQLSELPKAVAHRDGVPVRDPGHGTLAIVPAEPSQATYIQVSEFTVRGAQAGKPLADLSLPERYRWVPPAVRAGLPFNVAQLYMRVAEGIREKSPSAQTVMWLSTATSCWT